MDVAAFYRGELLLDDDGVRAHCSGGPLENAGEAYLFGPEAVWPDGWELEDRTVELVEPVEHPRAPGKTISVLPVGRGVRPELIEQLVLADQKLPGMLQLGAPEEMVEDERAAVERAVAALFGVEVEADEVEDNTDEPPDWGVDTVAGAFVTALALVKHPGLSVRAGAYDESLENLEIHVTGGKLAWLHVSPTAMETDVEPVADQVLRYAELYVADLASHVARGRTEAFPPTFQAIDLLERLADDGEPEPSDLEPRRIANLTKTQVPKLPKKQAAFLAHVTVFAAFASGKDVILLGDTGQRRPWTNAFVGLVRDGTLIPILVTDEAGGVSQLLDGDPYRFRLVVAALRDAVRANELEAAVLSPLPLPIDAWLSFDLPDIGDRLVDPEQWYVAEIDDLPDDDALYDGADTDALRAAYHAWFESLPLR